MNALFNIGHFMLHSGLESSFKIDCDALNLQELKALTYVAQKLIPPYRKAIGVPTGGLALAKELDFFADQQTNRILIVDDVLTTGSSMWDFRFEYLTEWSRTHDGPDPEVVGLVIFARGQCPDWVTPIFEMNPSATREATNDHRNDASRIVDATIAA
jgi:hypothetical protein